MHVRGYDYRTNLTRTTMTKYNRTCPQKYKTKDHPRTCNDALDVLLSQQSSYLITVNPKSYEIEVEQCYFVQYIMRIQLHQNYTVFVIFSNTYTHFLDL